MNALKKYFALFLTFPVAAQYTVVFAVGLIVGALLA